MDYKPNLSKRFKSHEGEALTATFNAMALPMPEHEEFFLGFDSGAMIFLEDEGCVLRIRSKDAYAFNHPRVLQPLGARPCAGDHKIEIMPGVKTPAGWWTTQATRLALVRSGINFWDHYTRNAGTLPDGSPVVIDAGALRKSHNPLYMLWAQLPKVFKTRDPQEKYFGALRRAFNDAWPEDQAHPDPDKMKKFWQLCRDQKKQGALVAGWHGAVNDYDVFSREIITAAEKYASRRRQEICAPAIAP